MKKIKTEDEFKETWNFKKVGLALLAFLIIFSGIILFFQNNLPKNTEIKQEEKVLSAKDEKLENVIEDQIDSLKQQALNIDVEEIASSSPEIQNLIKDLKALQNYPKNKAKEACYSICKGF